MTSLSVVLPLYNAEPLVERVLPPLLAAKQRGALEEVVVVDDGSQDGGAELYRKAGFRVVESGGRLGPGACRNRGVREVQSDAVLFIDSDVVMHDDVPERVREVFDASPRCVAVFGSYDDRPAARGVVTQYRNLLHHFVHHQGREQATTFWAGCGAVRRRAFEEVGGFDARRYPYPSIEDIELGYRLLAKGEILLRSAIQCTHLKRWTLRGMVHTDIFRRALPWSRLLLQPGYRVNDLNVTAAEKAKSVVAGLFWLFLVLAPFVPAAAVALVAAAALAFWVNRRFFLLVLRRNGVLHLAGAFLLHQLYYVYSAATFAYCLLESKLRRAPA